MVYNIDLYVELFVDLFGFVFVFVVGVSDEGYGDF